MSAPSGTAHPADTRVPPTTWPILTIVVPNYNEADNIPLLLERLQTALQRLRYSSEIIAVDDGSRDDSFARLQTIAAWYPTLRIVRFRRNFGQTAAFVAGFDRARGEIVVTMDADLQNDPQDIERLLAKIDQGSEICVRLQLQRGLHHPDQL